jgi:UDP-N-acetylglucosamine--N-acetylmuramyl-(pentapeptide) pyrophosphoryl-undecaprenol N-acetylglucosamine transferase
MKSQIKNKRIIISGGGTGGHVYPAISIGLALKEINPETEILFVGAEGKLEMQKVPQAGFSIQGLRIKGFKRNLSLSNFSVLFLLLKSIFKARSIIRSFKPDVVVGVGGYASAPLGFWAIWYKIPLVLQEQNSFAGLTNRILGKKASKICVAYPNMDRFFPAENILETGNPIRSAQMKNVNKQDAFDSFLIEINKPVLAVLGGSLGAKSINNALKTFLNDNHQDVDYQIIWQTGKLYFDELNQWANSINLSKKVKIMAFIDRMDYLFEVADVIVSRAGAGTISELALVAKPVILVPSPNVAEDHQTANAMALVNNAAAIMIKDNDLSQRLFMEIDDLMNNFQKIQVLAANIKKWARPDAANSIAQIIMSV